MSYNTSSWLLTAVRGFLTVQKDFFLEMAIKLNITCKLSFLVVLDHIFKTNQDRTYHEATSKYLETKLASEL